MFFENQAYRLIAIFDAFSMGNSPVPIYIPGYRMEARFPRSRKIPCPRALFFSARGVMRDHSPTYLSLPFPSCWTRTVAYKRLVVAAAAAVGEQMKGAGMVLTNDFGAF